MEFSPISIDQKTKDLVHYICAKASEHHCFGATILNKILWFSDVYSYLYEGKPISKSKYIKLQFGPVPEDICFILDDLKLEGKIAISESDFFGRKKKNFMSITEPDLNRIEKNELNMVNNVIDYICENHSAASISELTHDNIWEAAQIGEEIPLYAVLASRSGEISQSHMKWADKIIESGIC